MSKLLNIEIANTATQSLAVGDTVNFGTIVRKHCCANSYGIPTFSYNTTNALLLNQCGYYQVTYNAVVSGDAGAASIALYTNDVIVPYTTVTETITTADTQFKTVSFSTIVRVLPNSPVKLSIVNIGATEITIDPSNILVVKIC